MDQAPLAALDARPSSPLTVVIGVLLSWILATFVKTDPDTDEAFTIGQTFIFSTWLTTVLAAIMGTLLFTSEVQHGTLPTAVTAQPARWVIVAAKAAIASGFGLVMGIAGMAAGLGGAVLGGLDAGDTSGMAATVAVGAAAHRRWRPLFGLGVGMIIRHSSAAISIVLVWALVRREPDPGLRPAEPVPLPALQRRQRPARHPVGRCDAGDHRRRPQPGAGRLPLRRLQPAALAIGTVLLYRRDTA